MHSVEEECRFLMRVKIWYLETEAGVSFLSLLRDYLITRSLKEASKARSVTTTPSPHNIICPTALLKHSSHILQGTYAHKNAYHSYQHNLHPKPRLKISNSKLTFSSHSQPQALINILFL